MGTWRRTMQGPASPAHLPDGVKPISAVALHQGALDPYLRWAIATDWRGFRRGEGSLRELSGGLPAGRPGIPPKLRVIACAPSEDAMRQFLRDSSDRRFWLQVSPMYRRPIPGSGGRLALHFTATLPADKLDSLVANPWGLRWELALPRHEASTIAQATTAGRFGPQREELALRPPVLLGKARALGDGSQVSGTIGDAVVVIDYGCPFLNARFASDSGGTRVSALWDQRERPPQRHDPWWRVPGATGYGRELSASAIQKVSRRLHLRHQALDEAALYRSLDYLIDYEDPRRRAWFATHGAHVLDMAAGREDPLARLTGIAPQDAAGQASIVFVQLPSLTAADSSGGSLAAHLLDGLRYAMDQCRSTARMVVNVSYGHYAGPHDGRAMLETAIDELLERRKRNFAVVLGAGNARRADCHAQRTVHKDKSALLRLALSPDDTTDTFVEMWYPKPDADHPALAFRVRSAERDWSPWVLPGPEHSAVLVDEATGTPIGVLQHVLELPQYESAPGPDGHPPRKAMALLALAPTAGAVDDPSAVNEPGLWEIEVRLASARESRSVSFDAWIERDDPPGRGDAGRAEQPRFVGLDLDDERGTLSGMATGRHTVVVAGYRWSDGRMLDYSSLPAANAAKKALPLVAAPCEIDSDESGITGAAICSDDVFRMNGTSVAAPAVARRLFNAMLARVDGRLPTIERGDWAAVLAALADSDDHVVRRVSL